ncbi:MAG: DEAD/DEAH box helicase [Pseudomonadales bacterium]|nr:DEAD/DEAH box helicase [Pseudomonadales bacterium]
MNVLDLETAGTILDFSGKQASLENLGEIQKQGAVALHNMIADKNIGLGYLADEVGMGKTYIALGVVALMRYFNPSLRVLYICPSRNVQDKWIRDYKSFIEHNVKVSQNRIRTLDGLPAAPYANCRTMRELIESSSLGYYSDFFIGKNSFSMGLKTAYDSDDQYYNGKLNDLKDLLPAHVICDIKADKAYVKDQYAQALNYVLPTFDLVVIDEAHNFKHSKLSSDRNRVLSTVLGIGEGLTTRVKNALLLSATPYDRNIEQLRNQLKLVGKGELLGDTKSSDREQIQKTLKAFMVRRLNTLNIDGVDHTRNMYRVEHRTGIRADINLQCNKQKLVMALVQKKVGESLSRQSKSASFQTGMLASFESFAQTTKTETVQFDGEVSDTTDAPDRHVIDHIVDSYKEKGLGATLPHPKMDSVTNQLKIDALDNNRKQLVFVRRVKSVKEIKNKLEEHYNNWLIKHINKILNDSRDATKVFKELFDAYALASQVKNNDISDELKVVKRKKIPTESKEQEDNQPPKNDSFFTWFFRGAMDSPAIPIMDKNKYSTPENMRNSLVAKNNKKILLLEPNWANFLCTEESIDLKKVLSNNIDVILNLSKKHLVSTLLIDELDTYNACQIGFIEYLMGEGKNYLKPLFTYLSSKKETPDTTEKRMLTKEQVESSLMQETFATTLFDYGLENDLYPYQKEVYQKIVGIHTDTNTSVVKLLDKLQIHTLLISQCLRTGHGLIDTYLTNIITTENKSNSISNSWMQTLVSCLKQQKSKSEFSTFKELHGISAQLDLIIKTNIPDAYRIKSEGRRLYISNQLNPVSPINGATGETSNNRSSQARKFRMPGYPLVLVSTDVFQEGEDLHTFCDSVVHYGLSNSPVSIEQKTGRVDRVAALAHRHLLTDKIQDNHSRDNDKIQVSFPHVKQSIEQLQVRQVCTDMNIFLKSLHNISSNQNEAKKDVNTQQALLDKSAIPNQIMDFLETPYPAITQKNLNNGKPQFVQNQTKKSEALQKHVNALLQEQKVTNTFENNKLINVTLKSARLNGETILSGQLKCDEINVDKWSKADLFREMEERSISTHHRVCAVPISNGQYQLYKDVEMLVCDEETTQLDDVEDFFKRFESNHSSELKPAKSNIVNKLFKQVKESGSLQFDNHSSGFHCVPFYENESFGFNVTFNPDTIGQRSHKVYIYESDNHCVFVSKAVSGELFTGKNIVNKIIKYTWVRNNHTDIVEFYLDKVNDITGRAIHPIASLDIKEFEYCIYTLAAQADRLEYIFKEADEY